jgi:uncharacterized membrane protein YhaH (DUF805 family)
MTFAESIASGFRNYVNFSGRAARSEYWYWVLFVLLLSAGTSILDAAMFPGRIGALNALTSLITFLPGLAVAVRRLHDIGRSGWWILIGLTGIGVFVLIYWFCVKGPAGPNSYGPDPLAQAAG